MSRHQFPTGQVATSVPCRDLLETNPCRDIPHCRPYRDIKSMSRPPTLSPMSRHQIHVETSTTVAHVATSNPGRDTISARSGVSRSRRQTPSSDLPYCCPCRDLKNDVATSTQLSPIFATPRRNFFHVATSKCCRDINIKWPKSKDVILRPTAT